MPVLLSVECALCLDDDADGSFAALASCGASNFLVRHHCFSRAQSGHIYHAACITDAINHRSAPQQTCPICRKLIARKPKSVDRIIELVADVRPAVVDDDADITWAQIASLEAELRASRNEVAGLTGQNEVLQKMLGVPDEEAAKVLREAKDIDDERQQQWLDTAAAAAQVRQCTQAAQQLQIQLVALQDTHLLSRSRQTLKRPFRDDVDAGECTQVAASASGQS